MKRRVFLKRTAAVGAVLAAPDGAVAAQAGLAASRGSPPATEGRGSRERLLLDDGWRFHAGDVVVPGPRDEETYDSVKAGAAAGAAGREFDDRGWSAVDLPHDFVVEAPYAEEANLAQGGRIKEVGWYRRTLRLDPADRGRHLELQLDGLATTATVWFNGDVVAHVLSGYSSTYVDVTAFATFGDELNTIAVRVDSRPDQGWWYEGGGLYRHVWLVKRAPVHIVTDGISAHPVPVASGWRAPVEATVENTGEHPVEAVVEAVLFDPQGAPLARAATSVTVAPLSTALARAPVDLASPALWSVESPALHRVQVSVSVGGEVIDRASERIGFRTQRFDPDQGFFLNDAPVKIKGVCIHQDHAGLGVALPDSIIDFRLRRLKETGCNAIRSSHNAPTRELLDAADRLGFLVMDENRLFNSSPEYLALLEWMVRRDRNHPSVILWSVFNEEPLQGTPSGYERVRRMVAAVKRLDTTRPVTAAMNGGLFKPVNVSQAVDVVGFNYLHTQYDRFHAANPTKPMTSSEDTSAMMTRGEYVNDLKVRHVHDSYDDQAAEGHGLTHRQAWKEIATRPFLAGGFVWTGFDYRGEPQPMTWPTTTSSLGIMDLCGFPKAAFHIHQALWIKDRPVLAIVPHWTWPGREGQPIRVMVVSNVERVALRLNGALLPEQAADPFEMNEWRVPYAPGRLEAVGYRRGRVVAHAMVETTGPAARLRLTPDRAELDGDGRDATPVTVEVLDAQGRPLPTADLPVAFQVTGGRLIGVGNGDPNSHESDKAPARKLYNGLAQAIVQTTAGGAATRLRMTATAPGVGSASVSLAVRRPKDPGGRG